MQTAQKAQKAQIVPLPQTSQVKKNEKDALSRGHRFTQEQLQQEFNYHQAEKITKRLLEKGLITEEEFRRIMAENRRTFPTYLAPILPLCQ